MIDEVEKDRPSWDQIQRKCLIGLYQGNGICIWKILGTVRSLASNAYMGNEKSDGPFIRGMPLRLDKGQHQISTFPDGGTGMSNVEISRSMSMFFRVQYQ